MKPTQREGGNLEQALNSSAPVINPLEVIKEAFAITAKSLRPLLLAILMLIALTVVAIMIAYTFIGESVVEQGSQVYNTILLILQLFLLPPLTAALYWMGIQHSVRRTTSSMDLFRFIKQPAPFIGIAVIIALIQLIAGFLPVIIAFPIIIVVQIFTSMALGLAAEYRLPPVQALRASAIGIARRTLSISIIVLILLLFGVLSVLTYGLGFIWTLPMIFNVFGILYREIYGVEISGSVTISGDDSINDSDSWQA